MTIIGSVINVLSKNITNNSLKLTGIFDPRINPPTSDMYINCVTDVVAIINRVISFSILAAITDGKNISAKPTINVWEASIASGTCSNIKIGIKGMPRYLNNGVYSARMSVKVPIAMTMGMTPIHISRTFIEPCKINSLTPLLLLLLSIAFSSPQRNEV